MEEWDLYDANGNKINKTTFRGERLQDGEYHLVVNAWVMNSNHEFLISQRSPNKTFPYRWECTGGSVLTGESSIEGAMRELKEELGIEVNPKEAIFIGAKTRYYVGCPDILNVWLFQSEVAIEELILQKEEVCNAMWASVEQIEQFIKEGKFELNAYGEEVLTYGRKGESLRENV